MSCAPDHDVRPPSEGPRGPIEVGGASGVLPPAPARRACHGKKADPAALRCRVGSCFGSGQRRPRHRVRRAGHARSSRRSGWSGSGSSPRPCGTRPRPRPRPRSPTCRAGPNPVGATRHHDRLADHDRVGAERHRLRLGEHKRVRHQRQQRLRASVVERRRADHRPPLVERAEREVQVVHPRVGDPESTYPDAEVVGEVLEPEFLGRVRNRPRERRPANASPASKCAPMPSRPTRR